MSFLQLKERSMNFKKNITLLLVFLQLGGCAHRPPPVTDQYREDYALQEEPHHAKKIAKKVAKGVATVTGKAMLVCGGCINYVGRALTKSGKAEPQH